MASARCLRPAGRGPLGCGPKAARLGVRPAGRARSSSSVGSYPASRVRDSLSKVPALSGVDRMFVRSANCMLKPAGLSEAVRGSASRLRPKASDGLGRAARPLPSFARGKAVESDTRCQDSVKVSTIGGVAG